MCLYSREKRKICLLIVGHVTDTFMHEVSIKRILLFDVKYIFTVSYHIAFATLVKYWKKGGKKLSRVQNDNSIAADIVIADKSE